MSTPSRRATAGAGPSAAIRLEPGRHEARRPDRESNVTALVTSAASGPNSTSYSADETVRPDAIRDASSPGLRGRNPKLRSTLVSAPAGPSLVASRIAPASVVGRLATAGVTGPAVWGELGRGLAQATARGSRAASAPKTRCFTET